MWALVRLKGSLTAALEVLLSERMLDWELEKRIATEIERLPQVKWSRLFKDFSQELPSAKPGPKKQRFSRPPVCLFEKAA